MPLWYNIPCSSKIKENLVIPIGLLYNLGRPQATRYDQITILKRTIMSIIQTLNEDSKNINNICNFEINSKVDKEPYKIKTLLHKLTQDSTYPKFQLFCPYCASMDIFVTIEKSNHLEVDCLDCKKIWIDEKFELIRR